ncbi:nucleotidyltransferase substrate-binding family protein [Marvinbryantia formatexigens DSM 14469]|uniref:Nucleotidyltransferase substrate-binding family protein n=1 Tax=Marvinbryantia formatexigens DSM 14469 TaxID=478749 RepID=C6LJR9_9FIRM|nr:HI0074 family nucleotidyltransferase substrate-binding subunit [Marvinbryantia formatexigens]EET59192.1 nucleotidyltransferase substrate-binding family protein [Marvinbryantia formatexigens DSM 14469]UWO26201.1 nucleotidyltransferase substrate binding protein [Marvinbryantia formatexigens DSM 14469]SDG12851.1 nucleotidyltransferase substrate binding protein, HI0074 family [Marvinbryantia formatexigens]
MKKFENFCNAYKNLKDIFDYTEPYGNVELTGMVGLYEVCFEQSWKAMKEILERDGFAEGKTGSPRQILKTAYQAGLISDEELWMSALVARNNVTHAYNKAIAEDIIKDTKTRFYPMFGELKETIEKEWMM